MHSRPLPIGTVLLLLGLVACRSNEPDPMDDSGMHSPSSTTTTPSGTTAARPAEASAPTSKTLSSADRDFVHQAAGAGRFEVESSQLALQKAQDQDLRQFAQRMVDDHSRANRELEQIAMRKGVDLPARLDSKNANRLDRLRDTSANQFPNEYRNVQLEAHREAIELFEKASRDCDDPELKSFAQRTLPTLRAHRQHLEQMQEVEPKG
jgi:putative membrane protein